MMKASILLVDDDRELLTLLERKLSEEGFRVTTEENGSQALDRIRRKMPDLVILDVNMPELNGMEICKALRSDTTTQNLPVIMLTARDDQIDRVLGLEFGADDYITKPFNSRELVLRIKNALRRTPDATLQKDTYKLGNLLINFSTHEVTFKKEKIPLTLTEFKLLEKLIETPGKVQSRSVLLDEIWDYGDDVLSRTVDTHVQRLRSKLKDAGKHIQTVRGVGYHFVEKQ